MKKLFILFSLFFILISCDVVNNVAGTLALTQCKYSYSSIGNLTLGGINLQNANGISSLNPVTAAGLLAAFGKSTLPLQFTLNLNVKNPNTQTALLNGLQYILEIDNVEMTTGSLDSKLQVAGGQTGLLPLQIGFDLKKALSGQSGDAVKNMAYNFVGLGDRPSNVTIRLKPTLNVGGQSIVSPAYIPVSFTYGKGNK